MNVQKRGSLQKRPSLLYLKNFRCVVMLFILLETFFSKNNIDNKAYNHGC